MAAGVRPGALAIGQAASPVPGVAVSVAIEVLGAVQKQLPAAQSSPLRISYSLVLVIAGHCLSLWSLDSLYFNDSEPVQHNGSQTGPWIRVMR